MILAFYSILILYVLLIGSLIIGFHRIKEFKPQKTAPHIRFSITVPFRNEAKHLPKLLKSISALSYSHAHFECLFVDDESSDDSVKIITNHLKNSGIDFQILKNQRQSNSPKKDALTAAIQQSKFEWIVTTDADCIVPSEWLSTLNAFIQEQATQMVVGPVNYTSESSSFLTLFQTLDFLSLQGSTIGGFGIGKPFLCNGANLAYQKDTFIQLQGFDGNNSIASGDDVFLFEKFVKQDAKQVRYLKSKLALVETYPLNSWKEVVEQRTRWAAKSGSYDLLFTKVVGLIVFLMNAALIMSPILLFQEGQFSTFITLVLTKLIFDLSLIERTSQYYNNKLLNFIGTIGASILYPFFSVFIPVRSLFVQYNWKGRKFKK